MTSWQRTMREGDRAAMVGTRRAKFINGELLPNTKCQGWARTVAARCRFVSF
jgi:hypothetical protein